MYKDRDRERKKKRERERESQECTIEANKVRGKVGGIN